jgi:hypothetical protein
LSTTRLFVHRAGVPGTRSAPPPHVSSRAQSASTQHQRIEGGITGHGDVEEQYGRPSASSQHATVVPGVHDVAAPPFGEGHVSTSAGHETFVPLIAAVHLPGIVPLAPVQTVGVTPPGSQSISPQQYRRLWHEVTGLHAAATD